jgi:hypothetical protein
MEFFLPAFLLSPEAVCDSSRQSIILIAANNIFQGDVMVNLNLTVAMGVLVILTGIGSGWSTGDREWPQ